MFKYRLLLPMLGLLVAVSLAGCLARPAASSGTVATAVAEAAFRLMAETAAASSPTPQPPTPTITPSFTDTPTVEATSTVPYRWPMTVAVVSCGLGGPEAAPYNYAHETNIRKGKEVELLGIGNIDGYLVVREPYFKRPCWIRATDIKIFPGTDWTQFDVMTPGVPPQGQ